MASAGRRGATARGAVGRRRCGGQSWGKYSMLKPSPRRCAPPLSQSGRGASLLNWEDTATTLTPCPLSPSEERGRRRCGCGRVLWAGDGPHPGSSAQRAPGSPPLSRFGRGGCWVGCGAVYGRVASPRGRVVCPSWVLRRCRLWLPAAGAVCPSWVACTPWQGCFNPRKRTTDAMAPPPPSPRRSRATPLPIRGEGEEALRVWWFLGSVIDERTLGRWRGAGSVSLLRAGRVWPPAPLARCWLGGQRGRGAAAALVCGAAAYAMMIRVCRA